MKKIVLLLGMLALSASCAFAGTVAFEWDPSPDATVTNYCLYAATNSHAFINDPSGQVKTNLAPFVLTVNVGTNTTAELNVPPSSRWYLIVTAQAWNSNTNAQAVIESEASNELPYMSPPAAPSRLRIQLRQ